MKKATICLLLLTITCISIGQQNNVSYPSPAKEDYLQKSKRQKTAAWILSSGGAALFIIGAAIDSGEPEFNPVCFCYVGSNDGARAALMLAGIGAIGGSIPLFIASGRNKRKAAKLALINQYVPGFQKGILSARAVPSLSLKISL